MPKEVIYMGCNCRKRKTSTSLNTRRTSISMTEANRLAEQKSDSEKDSK